jgi:hypothetical protein
MATLVGKRYVCDVCQGQLICTAAGTGTLVCCDAEMRLDTPVPLPAAD